LSQNFKLCHVQKHDYQKYSVLTALHKFTGTSSDERNNHIDYFSIDRRRRSSIPDVRSFKGAGCDNDRYMVVAEVGKRLAVSEQATHRFHVENLER
jgi:hypothetical protein